MSFSLISFWATIAPRYDLPRNSAKPFQPLVEFGPYGCLRLQKIRQFSKKRFRQRYPMIPKCA